MSCRIPVLSFCIAMAPKKTNVMLNAIVEFSHNNDIVGRGKVVKASNLWQLSKELDCQKDVME